MVKRDRKKDVGNHIDTENIEYRECDTMFGKGYYTEKNNYCKVVWDYEKYIFIMEGNLSKDVYKRQSLF